MSSEKFSLIRVFLGKLGLSKEAVDDVVDLIGDFLGAKEEKPKTAIEFPYHLRDTFLSNAEISFYHVVRTVVGESAQVFSKVSLGDIFYVKSNDASKYRVYTNKIDRKHVDFLLCNPKAVRPFLGIELDDKSHQARGSSGTRSVCGSGLCCRRDSVGAGAGQAHLLAAGSPGGAATLHPAGCQSTAATRRQTTTILDDTTLHKMRGGDGATLR